MRELQMRDYEKDSREQELYVIDLPVSNSEIEKENEKIGEKDVKGVKKCTRKEVFQRTPGTEAPQKF